MSRVVSSTWTFKPLYRYRCPRTIFALACSAETASLKLNVEMQLQQVQQHIASLQSGGTINQLAYPLLAWHSCLSMSVEMQTNSSSAPLELMPAALQSR